MGGCLARLGLSWMAAMAVTGCAVGIAAPDLGLCSTRNQILVHPALCQVCLAESSVWEVSEGAALWCLRCRWRMLPVSVQGLPYVGTGCS